MAPEQAGERRRAVAQAGEEQGAVAAAGVDVDDVRGRGDGAELRVGEEQDGGHAAEDAAMGGRSVASSGRAGRRGARGLGEFGDRIVDPHT